jgi:hypothetical protein
MYTMKTFIISILLSIIFAGCSGPLPAKADLPVETTKASPPLLEKSPTPEALPTRNIPLPRYLPATTIDIPPKTIKRVTVTIDWAYADESRVSIGYTVSGLDWPDTVEMNDVTSRPRITSTAIANINSGAVGWGSSLLESGVMHGEVDQMLTLNAVDPRQTPDIDIQLDIPVDGTGAILLQMPEPGQQFPPPPVDMNLPVVGTFHFEIVIPIYTGVRFMDVNQTVEANGVKMTLQSLILNRSRVDALLCFELPSGADWGFWKGRLMLGKNQAYDFMEGSSLLPGDSTFPIAGQKRCSGVAFDVFYDGSPRTLTLTIPRLQTSLPDSWLYTDEMFISANQKLAVDGIVIGATGDPHNPFEVVQRPNGMPDSEAYPLVWGALADWYEGPWMFTVPVNP